MPFNSEEFPIFLAIVFILYWAIGHKRSKLQNILLLTASYVFYGWWDWRFCGLLFLLSSANYCLGRLLEAYSSTSARKTLLIIGLVINISVLAFFKYFNFFISNLVALFAQWGINLHLTTLNIILPIGISFYTFLSISYIIDVYNRSLAPTKNVINLFASLSFFPIILAGPIQRPRNLIPQFENARFFNYDFAKDGLRQILWGLFKKIVIADLCAEQVRFIFDRTDVMPGSTILLGVFYYAIQIYCDFSGYSDIAIGTGKLFGFSLKRNFTYPYFARNIAEFWRRWHISLTTWFRDYIFLPISFAVSRRAASSSFTKINPDVCAYLVGSLVTWSLTGLWHGANWTFVLWGMLHGLWLIVHHFTRKKRKRILKKLHIGKNNKILIFFEIISTFILTLFTWLFFRAESIHDAFSHLELIFSQTLFTRPLLAPKCLALIFLLIVVEWIQRDKEHALQIDSLPQIFRWLCYYAAVIMILLSFGKETAFIYFQF